MFWRLLVVIVIGIYALVIARSRRYDGHHRSLRCPQCGHYFPRFRNMRSGRTVPEDDFAREYCGCKMDEFDNESSFPVDTDDPGSW